MRSLAGLLAAGALALAACTSPSGSGTAAAEGNSAVAQSPTLAGEAQAASVRRHSAVQRAKAAQWRAFNERAEGWELCPEPVMVIPWFSPESELFVGTPEHIAKVNQRLGEALQSALELWSQASGLTFARAPMVDMRIDRATGLALPADGSYTPRSIIVALVSEEEAALIDGETVGLASYLHEQAANGAIDAATAAYDADYLRTADHDELVNLFAHEIGHALGLGHSPSSANIMFAEVSDDTRLGPGDIAGIRALTRPCAS